MNTRDESYTTFMLDYAIGALSPAERFAADLHVALSPEGASFVGIWDAIGGAVLERAEVAEGGDLTGLSVQFSERAGEDGRAAGDEFDLLLEGDLLALNWRKSIFGVQHRRSTVRGAELLRLDPGSWAPRHDHARRETTLVLRGAFSDEHGRYEVGDLAFCEPGIVHRPVVVGDEPCVCLVAREDLPALPGLLGAIGLGGLTRGWRTGREGRVL
ncbi:cupin domain-containing protein [bacterium]|nr:cupin domain-containing protein [bacterium]